MHLLNELSKEELLDVIRMYDHYIQDANEEDRYADGWYPVCIEEFYENDYKEIKETLDKE